MRAFLLYSRFYDFDKRCHYIGGVETYLRNLCDVLRSVKIIPVVIFPDEEGRVLMLDGVQLIGVATSNHWKSDLRNKAEELGNLDRDLLIFGSSTLITKSRFKKVIAIQHGIYWDTVEFKGHSLVGVLALLARVMQGKRQLDLHSLVSRMVCVDLNYINWMRALSVSNRYPYVYIPNFADISEPVRAKCDNGCVRVLFARRFEPIRGCGLLMDVMPRILSNYPNVELTIAGSGSMEKELHRAFDSFPRVVFTHYDASESVAFHERFDIALVPSIASEGTSLSLLEAMSAGCAVVATDVGGMSNIVLSGHNGLLVSPNPGDFYAAIVSLVQNQTLRQRLSQNARQTVEDSFSRSRWEMEWINLLGEFI